MKRRDKIQLWIFAVSAIGYFPFSEWISTTRIGTVLFLWGQMVYALPLMAAVLAIPVLPIGLLFRSKREKSLSFLLMSLVYIPCCISGIFLGKKARMVGMEAFAKRSQTLITAIDKYERDHSAPPRSLNDLAPHYISTVPHTGMMAYPEFQYVTGADAAERYADNRWVLWVSTPSGGINFDKMLYFPKQNYPVRGYGGVLEQVGTWAYVHE